MAITKIQSNAFPTSIDLSNVDLTIGANEIVTANIADLNITHAKLHTAMDLSGKTVTLPALSQAVSITSPSSAEGIKLLGRSSDDIGQLKFYENDGTTGLARLDARTTHFEVGSYNELRFSAGGVGNSHVVIDTSGNIFFGANKTANLAQVGLQYTIAGSLAVTRDGGGAFNLNRLTSDGEILGLWKDTNKIGYLGSNTSGGQSLLDISSENDASSNIRFLTYGSGSHNEVMRLASSGNVGIGATSPNYPLEVEGTATTNTDIVGFSNSNGTAKHIFGLENVGAGTYKLLDQSNNTAVFFSGHSADNSYINAGNVAIGRSSSYQSAKVTIENNAHGNYLYMGGSTENNRGLLFTSSVGSTGAAYLGAKHTILAQSGGGEIEIKNDGYTWLHLAPDGNVGVGLTNPGDKLDIQGADNGLTIRSAVANRPKITLINGSSTMMTLSANGTYAAIGDGSDANRYMAFRDGSVGIGSTDPYPAKLHVQGETYGRGVLTKQNDLWTFTRNFVNTGVNNTPISVFTFGYDHVNWNQQWIKVEVFNEYYMSGGESGWVLDSQGGSARQLWSSNPGGSWSSSATVINGNLTRREWTWNGSQYRTYGFRVTCRVGPTNTDPGNGQIRFTTGNYGGY